MNLLESKLWSQIKKRLPGEPERIENMVDTGIPDVHSVCMIDYWVELKVCSNKTKERAVSKMLRDSQILWHRKMDREGACIFVLVRYNEALWIYKYTYLNAFFPDKIDFMYKLVAVIEKKGTGSSFDWDTFTETFRLQIEKHMRERSYNGLCNSAAGG